MKPFAKTLPLLVLAFARTSAVFRWKSHGFTVMSTQVRVEAPIRPVWSGQALGTRAHHE
jgi:hypothetical protein